MGLIEKTRPDFVLVNQGLNFDAFDLLSWLSFSGIKYGVISQAVDHRTVLNESILSHLKIGFSNAAFNGFVSESNIKQTAEMVGMEIPNAKLFRNPVSLPIESRNISYPNTDHGYCLAFIGRLDFKVKGQDLLLEVLRQDKWCNRNLSVRFYGDGPDKQKLEQMLLDFPQGKHVYGGFKSPLEIWSKNHALVLTSHFEGLPIVIIEAGLCGRTCLVTDVSGNAELISDNVDGFVAKKPNIEAIDTALESAWVNRFEWQQMGELLRHKMIQVIPENPGQILADTILEQVLR
ncbi:MAG: glycosyltransferase [Arcticibacter sp.]